MITVGILRFVQFFIWILYISFLVTWYKTFIQGHYFEHAAIYATVFLGSYPIWGGWLAYKASAHISTVIKLEKNNK